MILWILWSIEREPAVEKKIILDYSPSQTAEQRAQLKNQLQANGFVVQESSIEVANTTTLYLLGTMGAIALSLLAYFALKQRKKEASKEAKILSFQKEEQQKAQQEEKKKFKG